MNIETIRASKDFHAIETVIDFLRLRHPRLSTTAELATRLGRPKYQVYGIVKIARRYLALTSGEFIPNVRKAGYQISTAPRAALWESIKSGHRAHGHLNEERSTFLRVDGTKLTQEDRELWAAQRARVRIGEAYLAISQDMKSLTGAQDRNRLLDSAARADSATPWADLGLDDPSDDGVH